MENIMKYVAVRLGVPCDEKGWSACFEIEGYFGLYKIQENYGVFEVLEGDFKHEPEMLEILIRNRDLIKIVNNEEVE